MAGNNQDESGASPDTAFDLSRRGPGPGGKFPAMSKLSDYLTWARQKFGPMTDEFLKLYPAASDREAFMSSSAANRDNNKMSTWMWATAWRQKNTKPIYAYFWTHAPPGPNHDLTGAFHGSEIAYVFDNLNPANPAWTEDDRRIADMMSSYWTNFAKTGNPNGQGLPAWPAFDGKTDRLMELGDHFQPIPLTDAAKTRILEQFYAAQPAIARRRAPTRRAPCANRWVARAMRESARPPYAGWIRRSRMDGGSDA